MLFHRIIRVSLTGVALFSSVLSGQESELIQIGAIDSGPVADAVQIDLTKPSFRVFPDTPERPSIRVRVVIEQALEARQPLLLEFRIRALGQSGEADASAGQTGLVVRIGKLPPKDAEKDDLQHQAFNSIALASGDWQEFAIPFTPSAEYLAGETAIEFAPAYFNQPVEVDGVRLTKRDPDAGVVRSGLAYAGQEPDAAWRSEADARIREHRMGNLAIRVTNVFGKPVEGASVDIQMTRHAYPFGTAIASVRIADGELWKYRENFDREAFLADNARYREKLKELFNFVVFENSMKWPQWVGDSGYPAQTWTLEALDWLRKNDFLIKGHTMVWASWNLVPEVLRQFEDDPVALQTAILSHIRDIGQATSQSTAYFDVLNEPMSHNDLIKIVGMERVAEWFKVARQVQPDTRLVLNDFDLVGNGGSPKRRKDFIAFVQELQERGAPIDMVGFQSHFWSPRLTSPELIWSIIDEFDQALGLPLMVSEFDMNLNDEQLQADYTADFLKAWFAHPATEAYIMWGFWGGAHWMRDPGAMIRRDWTEKPNLKAYTDLVFGEWWTNVSATSDAEGIVEERAFFGDYTVTVSLPDGRSLSRNWRHIGGDSQLEIQIPLNTEFRPISKN